MSALNVCPQCGTEYPASARFCETDGTALRSAQPGADLVGSIVADRYHVMKKLGEGGMGQVYLAEHVKMGRKSALKVMHSSMKADVDAVSRFNREAANASRIAHPNVAAVYDFGETPDGIIYLAMEFVDGPSLTTVIEQHGALRPARAAEIVRQTAEALAVAHDMGIVHRDLKPDNIMIARNRDGTDCAKVVDFGIAKAAGNAAQNVTKTGLVVGTPEYMSPEQLAGDKLDGRSDIYSLGLVAYTMLTGTLPFPSESAQESMIMRLTDKPEPLAAMKPETSWPVEVQAVMDKALERDANARYQNAIEFGMAFCNAIDRMPGVGASAVPATRVGVASGAEYAPTATMPRPSADRPYVTQGAATSKKSNKLPTFVVAAAVLVAVVIGAMKYGGDRTEPARAVASAPSGPAAANAGPATIPSAKIETPTSLAGSAVDPDTRLQQLMDEAKDSRKSVTVLRELARIPLKTPLEQTMGGLIEYNAYVFGRNPDQKKACDALKDVEGASIGTRFEDNVKGKLAPGAACSSEQ